MIEELGRVTITQTHRCLKWKRIGKSDCPKWILVYTLDKCKDIFFPKNTASRKPTYYTCKLTHRPTTLLQNCVHVHAYAHRLSVTFTLFPLRISCHMYICIWDAKRTARHQSVCMPTYIILGQY